MGARIPSGLMHLLEEVLPLRMTARTPDDFRRLQTMLNDWFFENNVTPSQVDIVPELIEGLYREEQFAKNFAREAAQMGLTDAQKEERWALIRDVPLANTESEVDAARARVSIWLARFPNEENAERWQHLLDTQQMLLDLMNEPKASTKPAKKRQLVGV